MTLEHIEEPCGSSLVSGLMTLEHIEEPCGSSLVSGLMTLEHIEEPCRFFSFLGSDDPQ
ncbi:MAG: hypothetical protein PHF39_13555 [Methanoregula sp.]|nr:hypothetical protein [Methanoregula sp.]